MPQDTTDVTTVTLEDQSATESPDVPNIGDGPVILRDDGAEPVEETAIPPEDGEDYAPRISEDFPEGVDDETDVGERDNYVPHILRSTDGKLAPPI